MAEFLAVAAAHFLALLSPGPDFFIIITAALRNGSKKASLTCLGISIANGLYILLAVAGIAFIRQHVWLLTGMKIAGACFLFYIGFMLMRSRKRELYSAETRVSGEDSNRKLFIQGFLSALLNPKNPVLYMSLYSLFISDVSLTVQARYGLWMFFTVLLWDVFVAFSIGNSRVRSVLSDYTHRIEQLSGIIIMTLGVLLGFQ